MFMFPLVQFHLRLKCALFFGPVRHCCYQRTGDLDQHLHSTYTRGWYVPTNSNHARNRINVHVWLQFFRVVLETLHFHPFSVKLSWISYGSHIKNNGQITLFIVHSLYYCCGPLYIRWRMFRGQPMKRRCCHLKWNVQKNKIKAKHFNQPTHLKSYTCLQNVQSVLRSLPQDDICVCPVQLLRGFLKI